MKEVQLKQVESLLAASETIEAILEDCSLINRTDVVCLRMTRSSGLRDQRICQSIGDIDEKGVLSISTQDCPELEVLVALSLRPVNDLAKHLYHSRLFETFESAKVLRLCNNDHSAMIEIFLSECDSIKVKLFNSMTDQVKVLKFDSLDKVFEEFMYGFYCTVTKREAENLQREYKLICVERNTRTNILENPSLLKIVS